jgi:hypothetical protein
MARFWAGAGKWAAGFPEAGAACVGCALLLAPASAFGSSFVVTSMASCSLASLLSFKLPLPDPATATPAAGSCISNRGQTF